MASSKRITQKDLDKRVVIKLDKTIKATDEGVHGLMKFGEANDYPQMMELAINGSVTAKAASGIYSKFLAGDGFENESINNIEIGTDQRGKKITVKSLLRQICDSCSVNNGFYVHVNKNPNNEVGKVHLKPFKNGRFAKPDDTGFSAKILFYDNWGKDKDRGSYKPKEAIPYHIFTNNDTVTQSQITNEKGTTPEEKINNFKGQVYFQFLDNTYFYPLSPFDAAYMDVDTEQQVALFKNRTIRNGFFNKVIVRKQIDFDINKETGEKTENSDVSDGIIDFIGADGESVLVIEDDIDPDTGDFPKNSFEVIPIETKVDSKLFDSWEQGLKNNIRMSIRGIPAVLIDYEQNQMGTTSGEAIVQATKFYNALTRDDRSLIEESFAEIFKKSSNELLKNNDNWKIKPLTLIEDDTTIDNNTTTGN